MTVWNKVDACDDPPALRAAAAAASASGRADTVCISGRSGEGITELLTLVGKRLAEAMIELEVLLPYAQGELYTAFVSRFTLM